jgi:hypothetical protein
MEAIAVSIITGVLTLIGVCVTAWASAKKTRDDVTTKLQLAQAVTDEKIENLTREVRKHNGFAERLPKLEQKVEDLASQLRD